MWKEAGKERGGGDRRRLGGKRSETGGGRDRGKEKRPWHLLCHTSDLSYAQHPNFSSQYGPTWNLVLTCVHVSRFRGNQEEAHLSELLTHQGAKGSHWR